MRLLLIFSLLAAAACRANQNLYHFMLPRLSDGVPVELSQFEKSSPVVLVVNVASQCGYTHQNYKELQALYEKYNAKGFTVLAVPCNQFGQQEPGTPQEISDFVDSRYGVTFPMFSKVDVNGPNEHPLFTFLKSSTTRSAVQWNFWKWLCVDGVPVKAYPHDAPPSSFEADIVEALENSSQTRQDSHEGEL